ncbi:M16 family metallopeptidase [Oxalobacteraceae bacterium A2-2]
MTTPILLPALRRQVAAALAVLSLSGATAAAPAPGDPLPIDPLVRVGKLDNGLTYYIQKNAKPAQRVELRLVVRAGSVLEDEDQRGMAHLLEHLGFNGSTHFKKSELIDYLESIGVRLGADLNAGTGFDTTTYQLPIPNDKPGNLERAMLVLEDWAHGLTLGDKEIEEERPIVLEEKRLRSGYGERQLEAILPKLANGSSYQDRLPIGTEDGIRHATPAAVRRFYTDWYRPDLMAVIMVGDVDPEQAEAMVKRHFAQMKMPARPRPLPRYPVPPLAAPDGVVYVDKEAPGNRVDLMYSIYQYQQPTTVGGYRDDLVRSLFRSMMGRRLARLPTLPEPPLSQPAVGEFGLPFGANQRTYQATAIVGKAGVDAAIDALVSESRRAREFGFTQDELEVARRDVLAGAELRYKARETQQSAALVERYIANFVMDLPMPGAASEYAYAQAFLPQITLAEINAHALAIIPDGPPKLVLYSGNDKAGPAPTVAALQAGIQAAQRLPVERLSEKPLPASLIAELPAPGCIVGQSEDAALGLTTLVLSNGVRVVLKPTAFSKNLVQMEAVRPGGTMLFADADKTAARYASAVQYAMGIGQFSPLDLSRMLAGKNAFTRASMSSYADTLAGNSRSEAIETMLQLNYLRVTSPRRDEDLFRSYVSRTAAQVRNLLASPEERFAEQRLLTRYGNHPRVELTPRPEEVEALKLDRIGTLFRSHMGSARDMTFILVGDFQVVAVKPLLERYVATLPTAAVAPSYRDPGIRQVPGVVRREFRAGVEQKSLVSFDFGGELPYSQTEATVFSIMADVLKLRITAGLREKQQLIYTGSVGGSYDKIPHGAYSLTVQLPTSPEKVAKVEAALWNEIASLQAQGPTAAELDKAKLAQTQGYRRALNENGYWMQSLRKAQLEGSDPHDILTVEQRVNAVTAAQVQAAARRFLSREQYVEMVLLPETTATAAAAPAASQP